MSDDRQFSTVQKWSIGMGSFAQWFINSAFNIWVFTFYFAEVKIPIAWYVLAAIIWTLWNAFNDPRLDIYQIVPILEILSQFTPKELPSHIEFELQKYTKKVEERSLEYYLKAEGLRKGTVSLPGTDISID